MTKECPKEGKKWNKGLIRTIVAALAANGNAVSVGMCQGYSAVLLPKLNDERDVSGDESSWIASLGVISNPLGSLLAGIMMEIFGRRATVRITTLPYILGWALIAIGDDIPRLYAGRVITGLAVGMITASFVYVAEISTPDQRGILAAWGPVNVSFGILLVYVLGWLLPWKMVAATCSAFAVASLVAMCSIPESPYWLISKGRYKEAVESLKWLRANDAKALAEADEIVHGKTENENGSKAVVTNSFADKLSFMLHPSVWKPFIILAAFIGFKTGSGIYIVLYYAVNLFRDVGTGINEYLASVIVGAIRLAMSIVGAVLIKNFGRRTLAVVSGIGLALSSGVAAWYENQYADIPNVERPASWTPLICVLLHVCLSMVGFLQLPWVMNGELFPLRVRGFMGGFVASVGYVLVFASVKTYPALLELVGIGGALWTFTGSALVGVVFCALFLPETRGKTLQEIELSFSPKKEPEKKIMNGKSEIVLNPADIGKFTLIKDVHFVDIGVENGGFKVENDLNSNTETHRF